ncbi:MAG: hypothetical protein CVV64_01280 [Candidatus Wallbacteria bacterium HGW-Wallbacteria-1]|uniref:HAMP domain-containing protein n=1 Tax=Candidatus Wallbacteria bacterium HGW-Wallbacteria-1 TaxID=2013854 RepID=A0A2N1PUT6_9BACT|nr:MAG: hypothetical protein CVV64_01280 [Candidatus Wallbacteria bacterium HGW-Wallbacteria-1]
MSIFILFNILRTCAKADVNKHINISIVVTLMCNWYNSTATSFDERLQMASKARRQYLINKGFQARLTMIILLLVIIVANVTGGLVFAVMKTDMGRSGIFMLLNISNPEDMLLPAVIASEVISVLIVAMISLFVTHRMAGPVYRFERVIEDMLSGRLNFTFKIRDKDEFKELASMLDSLIGEYCVRIDTIKDETQQIRETLDDNSTDSESRNQRVRAGLEKVGKELDFFRTSVNAAVPIQSGGSDE